MYDDAVEQTQRGTSAARAAAANESELVERIALLIALDV
jgi:hypothetical protein